MLLFKILGFFIISEGQGFLRLKAFLQPWFIMLIACYAWSFTMCLLTPQHFFLSPKTKVVTKTNHTKAIFILGCKPKALCMPRPKDEEGEFCPSHSVCPKECQWDEVQCSDGIDSRGCKNEDLCISRKKDKYGNLCQAMCPPKCTDNEFFCLGTVQSDGCRGQSLCVEKKLDINGIVCPEICPKACSDRELRVHQGSDPRGCLLEDICVRKYSW